jgi:hypothetical protein
MATKAAASAAPRMSDEAVQAKTGKPGKSGSPFLIKQVRTSWGIRKS